MKITLTNLILIIAIGILGFMYLTKSPDIPHDTSIQDSLNNVITAQHELIVKDSIVIDSLNTLILKEQDLRIYMEKELNLLTKKYENQITSIDSSSTIDNINFFRSRYLSETKGD